VNQIAKRKRTLFGTSKHKYLSELITYTSVEGSEKASRKAKKWFKDAKTKRKKLRIVRSVQLAENRIRKGFLKKKNLKPSTKKRLKEIADVYGKTADDLWDKYDKL
jgi:hypothetical protein